MITINKQTRYSRLFLSIVSLSVLIAGWWLITALQWVNPLYLPAPAQIGQQFLALTESGYMNATLWQHLAASLDRMLKALLLAVITGIPLGVLMGLSARIRGILDPVVELYRPVPPLAYLPLIVIWFGIGETTKILLIWLAILAPVLISTMQGIMAAPGNPGPRSAVAWREPVSGTEICDSAVSTAADADRHPDWSRCGLVNPGGG